MDEWNNFSWFTCSNGTSSIGSSAPRSPRATIAYKYSTGSNNQTKHKISNNKC